MRISDWSSDVCSSDLNDNPAAAEALLGPAEAELSPNALTEWRQRVAWSYYIENDDANARRMAAKALENGSGPWLSQAYWVAGMAAWRQNDCLAAASAFENVASRADTSDIPAGGFFWVARVYMSLENHPKVEGPIRNP